MNWVNVKEYTISSATTQQTGKGHTTAGAIEFHSGVCVVFCSFVETCGYCLHYDSLDSLFLPILLGNASFELGHSIQKL